MALLSCRVGLGHAESHAHMNSALFLCYTSNASIMVLTRRAFSLILVVLRRAHDGGATDAESLSGQSSAV